MSFSMFSGDSPPKNILTPNSFSYMQRHSPVAIEQNISFTRGGQNKPQVCESIESKSAFPSADRTITQPSSTTELQTEEDAHFLRLAHEALVATSAKSNLMVDPTIQDLLARLQYVSSPHGNPIKHSKNLCSNEDGRVELKSFYRDFPNLSNDIFIGNPPSPPANKKADWNMFLDKTESIPSPGDIDIDIDIDMDIDLNNDGGGDGDGDGDVASHNIEAASRKYPCSGCSMSFSRSSDLKRHERQHLTVPANICSVCGKGFARRDALKRHAGTMTCKRNADKKIYHSNLDLLINKEL